MKLAPRAVATAVMLGVSTAVLVAAPLPVNAQRDLANKTPAAAGVAEMPTGLGVMAADTAVDTDVYQPPSVVAQFNAMSVRADALGFGIGSSADPTVCKHYQGVARSEGPGDPFLFVTHSRNDTSAPGCTGSDDPGELLVVDMASRGDDGERLRSNRLQPAADTIESPPPAGDTTTNVVRFDGTDCNLNDGISGWPGYHHPGGVQLVGDILAVPLEKPIQGTGCPSSMIAFVDVSNPDSPLLRSWKALDFEQAGVVAVTRQPDDGRFLMIVTGGGNDVLHVLRSQGTDLAASDLAWDLVFDYDEAAIEADIAPRDWPTSAAYQTLNLVREAGTDQLFLFAARGDDFIINDGQDLLDLYKVVEGADSVAFEFVGQNHLYTVPTAESCGADGCESDEEIANFTAASGIYVSPSGNILLYATEHDNDGPEVGGVTTVKAAEWRNREIVRSDSPTLLPTTAAGGPYTVDEGASIQLSASVAPPITRAWVELFVDDDFTGRSVIVDHPDRTLDDFDNFDNIEAEFGDLNGFSDDATAMRWFAPDGCTFNLNEHHVGAQGFPGVSRTVVGDGIAHEAADLGAVDDKISSITWSPNCEATYNSPATAAWDLDGDNVFETAGLAPTFSAQTLDGPTTRVVTLQASQAASALPGLGSATVQVSNVAPSLSGVAAVDSLGNPLGTVIPFVLAGQPVRVGGSFTDPGVADTHVASVAWGDDVVDEGAANDTFSFTHSYAQPGSYQAVATVTDDDGGTATQPITIDVVDPAAAIEGIADQLDDLLDDGYTAAVNDALSEALQQLVGGGSGNAASGALDKLEAGDTEAAVVKLIAAVEALQQAAAAGGPNVDATIDLLGLIGQALAEAAYAQAQVAVAPASPGEQHQLDTTVDLIATGVTTLAGGDHLGALDAFRAAVRKAQALID